MATFYLILYLFAAEDECYQLAGCGDKAGCYYNETIDSLYCVCEVENKTPSMYALNFIVPSA